MVKYTAAPSRFCAMKLFQSCRQAAAAAVTTTTTTTTTAAASRALTAASFSTSSRAVLSSVQAAASTATTSMFNMGGGLASTSCAVRAALRAVPQPANTLSRRFSGMARPPTRSVQRHLASMPQVAAIQPDDVEDAVLAAGTAAAFPFATEQPLIDVQRTPLIDVVDEKSTREYIREYFHATYNKTEDLFGILKGEAPYYLKSEPLRHPPIFYLGHTACFYINKLMLAKIIRHRVNPKIEHMCAVGVDEMSWDDLNTDHYDWPSIAEVQSYREQVRDIVDNLIRTLPMDQRLGWESDWWPILMGIEHENIHTETSSAIFRQIDLKHIQPSSKWPLCPLQDQPVPQNELVNQPGSQVVFDKTKENAKYYGWDNEFGQKVVPVSEHRASKYLVSNAEFLEFVEAGGYRDPQWWTEEGWTWVTFEREGGLSGKPKDHPRWWVPAGGEGSLTDGTDRSQWKLRCLQEEIPMPWSWPVNVNQVEAKAFCNWKSARDGTALRLPSEAEWYSWRNSGGHGFGDSDQPAWAPNSAPGNINLDYFASECPVDMFKWGDSGLFDVVGNVWQWTETPIDALPGYEVHPLYDDFSSPTFDGLHSVIKGGSWISIGCNGATKDSRYAFRRHFYQHAGFRYVESEEPVDQTMTVMENDPELARELDAQYTLHPVWPGCQPFAVQCADLVHRAAKEVFAPSARDAAEADAALRGLRFAQLGCSVGRTCFELADVFNETVGFDQTARRIQHAVRLQEGSVARYVTPQDGTIQDFHGISLDALGLESDAARDRVQFSQADACNIDVYKHGSFDVVLAAGVLENLYAPKEFLDSLHALTNPGGLVILGTTCNWDESKTPSENWLGGYKCETSGENVHTIDKVEELLTPHFEQVLDQVALPCVAREAAQSFSVANCTFTMWRRKL